MLGKRAATLDAGLPNRELAEVEIIKAIIKERVIAGKCDSCERVKTCIMAPAHRELCEVVKASR